MHLLVTYDISTTDKAGARRLRRAAKITLDYGQRVQNSVFECKVDPAQFTELKGKLLDLLNLDTDSIRFYNLGAEWDRRVEHYGQKPSLNPDAPLIV
ncbi:MAG: CRISPR-associated endonuclease Cas2 [Chthoniobacterales bacterium]